MSDIPAIKIRIRNCELEGTLDHVIEYLEKLKTNYGPGSTLECEREDFTNDWTFYLRTDCE